jgi:DNA-binding beta-propeller fold protein YncE
MPIYAAPTGIAVSKDGAKVYVPCYGGPWAGTATGWISVLDTADGGVESFYANTANARPLGLAFNPEGTEFWFGCGGAPDCAEVHAYPGNATTHVIDQATLTGGGIAVLPDGGDAFFANNCGCCGTFMRVNESSQTVTDTVSGDNGGAMVFTPDWRYALWSHENNCSGGNGVIVRLDTSDNALGPSLALPTQGAAAVIAVTADGASFYAIVAGQVWKVDVASMAQTGTLTSIPVGAVSIALSP